MTQGVRRIVARAYAKVNLGLEILGRRPEGYHEIATVLHEIDLHDSFVWTDTGRPFAYVGPPGIDPSDDLVRRVLEMAPDRGGWTGTLRVRKRIPIAAGLGGGSSDAALALRLALRDVDHTELALRARVLGSDVPFFLRGGTALATGTGTTLEDLPSPRMWFLIVVPEVAIAAKTAGMYARLTTADFSDGSAIWGIVDALRHGAPPVHLPNTFLRHVPASPSFERARAALAAVAPEYTLSGAGPALFAIVGSRDVAGELAARIPAEAGRIIIARSLKRTDDGVARLAAALRGTIVAEQ